MEDPRIISALFIFLKMAYYNVLINRSNLVGQVQLTEIKNSKNQEEAECRKK